MNLKLLIVEDNGADVFLILRNLEKAGFHVDSTQVDSHEMMKEALENETWDVVISDYNIPGFGGLEALMLLKEMKREIPFILVSGTIGEEAAVSILKNGANDYVMKNSLIRLPEAIKREIQEFDNRKMKLKFQEQSERLSRIIEFSKEIVLTFDMNEKVNYLNKFAITTLQLNGLDIDHHVISDLFSSKTYSNFESFIFPTLNQIGFWEGELNFIKRNGAEIPVIASIVKQTSGDSTDFSILAIDIIERKAHEMEIINLNKNLESLVRERTGELLKSYVEIEQKNKEVRDSINYALRIQKTVLPKKKDLLHFFKESFVFELPRDIVSGDFYWFAQKGDLKYVAVVDCTGHGVPGAFISIIANRLLDKAVDEFSLINSTEILEFLDKEILKVFSNSNIDEYNISDGMDIALCVINETKRTISFSGANRPLLHLSNDELKEISGTHRAIGSPFLNENKECFEQEKIIYNDGDSIYLYSDGYQSQFGGPKGKKANKKLLKEVIVNSKSESINRQGEHIIEAFYKWKLDNEQVDDICIVGVKL